jgi:multiple sugar transport system ATP-binding protein
MTASIKSAMQVLRRRTLTESSESSDIDIDRVSKVYPGGVKAVDDVSLRIETGEFMVLVGPSGCGKTTLLRTIAGLEDVTSGSIRMSGDDITDVGPQNRDIAMVFQNYALYPHMSVRANLGYGLKVRRFAKDDIAQRVDSVARMLGLDELLERRPAALSGGQRQRVAMGRAIVREPRVFLMDEPLSNLDAKLRVTMRTELSRLHRRLERTTVYVTHDQTEAVTLGDRVAVMRDGKIEQVASPQELYDAPANLYVAAFIGSPAMNLVHGTFDGTTLAFGEHKLAIPSSASNGTRGKVILGMRPEAFMDSQSADPGAPKITVTPTLVERLGADTHMHFEVDSATVETEAIRAAAEDQDTGHLLQTDRAILTARLPADIQLAPGTPCELAFDTRHLHFFDPDSGQALRGVAPVERPEPEEVGAMRGGVSESAS